MDQVLIETLDHCLGWFSSVGNDPDIFGDLGDPKAGLIPLPSNPLNAKQTNETSDTVTQNIALQSGCA